MRLLSRAMPDNHDVVLTSCWHEGNMLQLRGRIEEMVELVATNPFTYIAHLGDWAEGYSVDDKRYCLETDTGKQVLNQYLGAVELARPVADKMLFALMGNHDWKLCNVANWVRDIVCRELNIPYGTYTTKFTALDLEGNQMYKLYASHGRKGIGSTADDPIRRDANMRLQLKRHLQDKAGDCIVMAKAHVHKLIVAEPTARLYLTDDGSEIRSAYTGSGNGTWIHPDHRWYAATGTFLRLFPDPDDEVSGYGELAEYDPVELGYMVVEVRDRKVVNIRKVVVG